MKERLDAAYGGFSFDGDRRKLVERVSAWLHVGFHEPRPGAPKMVTTVDNVTKVHNLGLTDPRLKEHAIAETVGISKTAWVISCLKYWP